MEKENTSTHQAEAFEKDALTKADGRKKNRKRGKNKTTEDPEHNEMVQKLKEDQSERIKGLLSGKFFENKVAIKQQIFAQQIGISQSAVSQLLNARTTMSMETLHKISETYDIDCNWLVQGEGPSPFKNSENAKNLHGLIPITVNEKNEPAIVLVPVRAQAGYAAGRIDKEYIQELPTFKIPTHHFKNGTFRAFEVEGSSMEPTLKSGDYLITRQLEDVRWLRDMYLYVFVTEGDVLVKRAYNRIKIDGTIVVISDNEHYPWQVFKPEEILEVWAVEARLTMQFMNSSDYAYQQLKEYKERHDVPNSK